MTTETTSAPAAVDAPVHSEPDFSIFENYEPEESSLSAPAPAAAEPGETADTSQAEGTKPVSESDKDTPAPSASEDKTKVEGEEPKTEAVDKKADESEDNDRAEDGFAHGNLKVRLRDRTETTVGDLKKLAGQVPEVVRVAQSIKTENDGLKQQLAAVTQERQNVQQLAEFALTILGEQIPPMPDAKLLDEDQYEYFRQEKLHQLGVQRLRDMQEKKQSLLTKQQQEQAQKQEEFFRNGEHWLQAQLPQLKDPQVKQQFDSAFVHVGRQFHFQDHEIANARDPRIKLMVAEVLKGKMFEAKVGELQAQIETLKAEKVQEAKTLAAKAEEKAKEAEVLPPIQQPAPRVNIRQRENQARRAQLDSLKSTTGRKQRDAADAFLSQFD